MPFVVARVKYARENTAVGEGCPNRFAHERLDFLISHARHIPKNWRQGSSPLPGAAGWGAQKHQSLSGGQLDGDASQSLRPVPRNVSARRMRFWRRSTAPASAAILR